MAASAYSACFPFLSLLPAFPFRGWSAFYIHCLELNDNAGSFLTCSFLLLRKY
uniref:Uncharacterized protein n=1 Tax=Arundo donax TaxID=35708 RepID=A0A0A8YSI7_ARUDO